MNTELNQWETANRVDFKNNSDDELYGAVNNYQTSSYGDKNFTN
jgi:hypothetical protein